MATTTKPASDKQRQFIARLTAERQVPEGGRTPAEASTWERHFDLMYDGSKFVSSREASAVIDWLFTLPKKRGEQPEVGIYVLEDGAIVQAKENKAKTNVYTKLWVGINGERLTLAGDRQHGEWEYDPKLKGQLATARRMTLDEAKQFILIYGRCVRCGRTLKAADSVERGIGPVCIQYFEQFS